MPRWPSDYARKTADMTAYRREWTTRVLSERKANGLCLCGQPPAEGYKRCAKCRSKHSNERTRSARRALGLCNCGMPPVDGCKQCQTCKDRLRQSMRSRVQALQRVIYDHYGRACACCGYDDARFLTIDHVNNDGAEWRAKSYGQYAEYVRIAATFPDDIQILCMNCNFAKARFGGVCPHESDKREARVA